VRRNDGRRKGETGHYRVALLYLFDGCLRDVIKLWIISPQIFIALFEERVLFAGANAAARLFTVFRIQRVGDFHTFNYFANGQERSFAERLRVVAETYDRLRRAAVRVFESKEHCAAHV